VTSNHIAERLQIVILCVPWPKT